eukprot:485773_1
MLSTSTLYLITLTLFRVIRCEITIIEDKWNDDYQCDSPTDEWSNCELIYENDNNKTIINTKPIYHGPYSFSNSSNIILFRSFQCKYKSHVNISFYAAFNCLFDPNDFFTVDVNEQYDIFIENPNEYPANTVQNPLFLSCDGIWDELYIQFKDTKVESLETFAVTFSMESVYGELALYDIQIECIPFDRWSSVGFLNFRWSTIASVVYFGLYVLLLVMLAINVQLKHDYDGFKDFFKKIWKMRSIFGAVLVHLYDTATDIGVMIDWWFLAKDEADGVYNYESIDMNNLFWTSVAFLLLYRILNIIMVAIAEEKDNLLKYFFNLLLSFFDMYILKTVWVAASNGAEEPSGRQRLIQMMESVCESLPQILLQSVFIMRGYNDENLRGNSSVLLVSISLGASVLSITNKYVWLDEEMFWKDWREAELKPKCPCINFRWILRVFWRFSTILTRLIILALVWVVLGGVFLPIYCIITYIWWMIYYWKYDIDSFKQLLVVSTMSLVSNPVDGYTIVMYIFRFIEDIILMSLLTTFAYIDKMGCGICADKHLRQATNNVYISFFIIAGWSAFAIGIFLLIILKVNEEYRCVGNGNGTYNEADAEEAAKALQGALEDL